MALLDSYTLSVNATFQSRVQAALVTSVIAVANEATSTANHQFRLQLVHSVLANPTNLTNYVQLFSFAVATDVSVISDATQAGTVVVTPTNVPTQQALVTDAHINSAVSSAFNAFAFGIPF